MKTIFVAATGQHVGKTTSTLGLVANLQELGLRTGYCKPVGQQYVTVDGLTADKDAVLFSKMIGFNIDPSVHSPVILGSGVTAAYIENPSNYTFRDNIKHAQQQLEADCDLVVYEGTGHPGVGSVVDLSNAEVAQLLHSAVIMVVEGGIGNTIDRLSLSMALFKEKQIPILGIIVNKVRVEKIEKVRHYLSKKLEKLNIPLLGVLPYDQNLSLPIMATIRQAVDGKVIMNDNCLGNKVEDIIAGSLVDIEEFNSFQNLLLVVSYKRLKEAIQKIITISKIKDLEGSPVTGVIVTGDGRHATPYEASDAHHAYLKKHKIPVITTTLDTYGSVVKISRIEVKINVRTPWKVKRAIELIREHVDFDLLLHQLKHADS